VTVHAQGPAIFDLVAAGLAELGAQVIAGDLAILGMNIGPDGLAFLGGHLAGRNAADAGHSLADPQPVGLDVPLELAEPRGAQGQGQALAVQQALGRRPRLVGAPATYGVGLRYNF
jgi:hypothetical protein